MGKSNATRLFLPAGCWVWMACFASFGAAVQPAPPFTVTHWDVDSGLPPGPCSAVLQTRDGYLWLGTEEGLARFDGVNCAVYDRRNTPALLASRITSLYEDRQSALWIGTEGGGLTRLHNGEFRTFSREEGLRNDQISALIEDGEGTLWVGTDGGGLFRFDGTKFARVEVLGQSAQSDEVSDRFVVGLASESTGALLVAYRNGLRRIYHGKIETYRAREDLGLEDVAAIFCPKGAKDEQQRKVTWIGTRNRAWCFPEGRYSRDISLTNVPVRNVQTFASGPEGHLWVGTAYGLFCWDGRSVRRYTTAEGLTGNVISGLWIDFEGSVWVGNNASGIDQIKQTKFQVYAPRQGLSHEVATCIYQDSRGDMWLGTEGGLNHFRNGQITQYTTNSGLSWNLVLTVCEGQDGAMWIGTLRGLNRFAEKKFTVFRGQRDGLPANAIWCSYRDRDNNLWLGTRNGLLKRAPSATEMKLFDYDNSGLSHNDVRAICEDNAGRLWVGTSYGLNRLEGERFVSFRGAASNRAFKVVLALYPDRDGTLWIGTMDKGLFRFKDDKFTGFTTKDGLHDDLVHQILEDDENNLWLTCNRGIARVSKRELNAFAEGKARQIRCVVFGKADGLPSAQCNGTIQPAGCKSQDGRLWFPTVKGVAVIDPANIPRNTNPPPVHIEKLLLNGKETAMTDVRVKPEVERVEIQYTGLSFMSPSEVRFRYRLEGLDDEWVNAKSDRMAHYTYLPAGSYQFRVQAANNDGIWNEAGALLAFTVVPPWWQTWWFRGAAIIGLVGLFFSVYEMRIQQHKRARTLQESFARRLIESQEQERKRVANELHDSLGQSLQVIKGRAQLGLTQADGHMEAAKQFQEISEAAGKAIQEARAISYALRPAELDQLGLTKAIQWMVEKVAATSRARFACELDALDGLFQPETEINLYRIVQEAVNNVIKHAGATEVILELKKEERTVRFSILDNGRGFATDARQNGPGISPSLGLTGMSERAKLLGGALNIQSSVGKGTRLTVIVGIHSNQT